MQPKTPSPIDMHVGSQIRLHRKMIGMSQTALAERLGITFQQVQKYEKGTNRVGASRIQGIASILGIKVNALFPNSLLGPDQEASGGSEGRELEAFAASTEGFALNQAFTKIKSANVRRRIVALVCALATAGETQTDDTPTLV
ncbi:helix-turn-helix domain-containing protein [Rhizobium glycinendophyticum]|uniref:Helix-turn-helix transcriptional regulator n=1 Tax=Rhizobium glycinendophyticum TaxID=2589807 RepID=A0A504UG93_9HYPH|nr:helix-turn-helix transcriptional regulator [Rhizobium glycinendophyticum]TPP05861.1 helix-turn-helix transcriptional regulator [Rhizobium glycinendophyticum]